MGLSEGDAERLQQTLAAVSDVTSGARWGALEQLRYFCEGAHPALLEAIAAKRFGTLPALLRLLADVEACGGPLAVRSQPEEARVPTGSVLQLLESLLCNATNNLKPFLKNAEGVRLLLAIVSHQEELVHDVEQASLIPASIHPCHHSFPATSPPHSPLLLPPPTQFPTSPSQDVLAALLTTDHASPLPPPITSSSPLSSTLPPQLSQSSILTPQLLLAVHISSWQANLFKSSAPPSHASLSTPFPHLSPSLAHSHPPLSFLRASLSHRHPPPNHLPPFPHLRPSLPTFSHPSITLLDFSHTFNQPLPRPRLSRLHLSPFLCQDGLTLLDRASNVLCYCAFHHPELTASQLVANNGVAIVCRLLQLAYAHYMRTLARPGTALPSRPPPQADSIHRT